MQTVDSREQIVGHLVDIYIPVDLVEESRGFIVLDEWGGLFVININARSYRLRPIIITLVKFSPAQITGCHFAGRTEDDVVWRLAVSTDSSAR